MFQIPKLIQADYLKPWCVCEIKRLSKSRMEEYTSARRRSTNLALKNPGNNIAASEHQ